MGQLRTGFTTILRNVHKLHATLGELKQGGI